ncbi:MAG: ribonuclease Z, partial [bacterium]|nr:ribonuclease Z [bacterium]
SIAYGLQERFHININKDRLTAMGLPAGKWLRQFKDALWAGQPDDASIRLNRENTQTDIDQTFTLGALKNEIVSISSGQKLVYVADCRGTEQNFSKIVSFAAGADVLFCEAAFLDVDGEKALIKGHLTAGQAGRLARDAGVKKLKIFHFSPRYEGRADELYSEAENAFCG